MRLEFIEVMAEPNASISESKELCDLAKGYSFILQSVLGVLAFSTLIGKSVCLSELLVGGV